MCCDQERTMHMLARADLASPNAGKSQPRKTIVKKMPKETMTTIHIEELHDVSL